MNFGNTNYSSGTLNVNGGTIVVPAASTVNIGNATSAMGVSATVNLNGGVFEMPGYTFGSATPTSTLNFNGGTLEAAATSATFLGAGTTTKVNLYANGGTINTNGQAITIGNAIVNPSTATGTFGATSVTVNGTQTAAAFASPPAIAFSASGGGTPPTGYAYLNSSGQIAGIEIATPGTFGSGNASVSTSVAGLTFVVNNALNSGGGLTVNGGGTLTLTGTNTYTAATSRQWWRHPRDQRRE